MQTRRGKAERPKRAREFSEALITRGIDRVLHISEFGHSWITWRGDLYYEFAPKLFQKAG